ncbi:DcaP family trimeric outer membrane transporter [Ketobacter sp.]|uniref:DcaP family trimeric outer membrane transporter n=1 Tax=Ketobacter sp. TaxID=2083498 RepID=UPI0025C00920|nr:DcaP family trimeric outer membrane transporter [Ketobacter sp.]
MKRLPLTAALVSAGLISAPALADDVNQRIEKLEQEIQALKTQTQSAAPGTNSSSVTVGGYIKLDAMVSDYSDGRAATASIGEDFLVPSTIPTGGESGDPKTHFSAKESRFWIKGQTQTDAGLIKGMIEVDFQGSMQGDERISNSYSPRIRHAFFTWDEWLFGQTWSTFFNVSALPDLLDFVGPVSTIFIRQPQIRYTSGGWMFAAENPSSTLYNDAASSSDSNQYPDLIARYNFGGDGANYSVAVMGRELAYDTGTDLESEFGYAVSLAGKINIGNGGDDLRVMLNAGNALGRYMGLNSFRAGAIEADGSIELIDEVGVFAAYRHLWNQQWRSSFSLAASQADNPDSAGNAPKAYESFHANLIYKPSAPLDIGGEIIIANKELEDGTDGSLNRLQFSAKYSF